MLKQIRYKTFETNSSSHSLSIYHKANDTVDISNKDTITLVGGVYCWGYDELESWYEKANYLSVEAINYDDRKTLLEEALKERFPNAEIIFEVDDNNSYIDHQSSGEIWDEIMCSGNPKEYIYDVLFGDATIFIDNDNH